MVAHRKANTQVRPDKFFRTVDETLRLWSFFYGRYENYILDNSHGAGVFNFHRIVRDQKSLTVA